MRYIRVIWLLATVTTLGSCDGTGLDAARDLTGSFTLIVTSSTELISTTLPCVPVGASSNEALFGSVNSSDVTFELFMSRTEFDGAFTADILNATFTSTLPNGIVGTMRVTRQ